MKVFISNFIGFSVLILFLASCTSMNYRPDKSLLKDWSESEARKFGYSEPYVVRFENEGKHLSYIASKHAYSEKSNTFKLIAKEFHDFKPDIVIVEGVGHGLGRNPPKYLDMLKIQNRNELWKKGEPMFVVFTAHKLEVPFVGGEPSRSSMNSELIKLGYSKRDIFGFYQVQRAISWNRKSKSPFGKNFKQFSKEVSRLYQVESKNLLSEKELHYWYKTRNKMNLDLKHAWVTAPINDADSMFTQIFSRDLVRVRDSHIVSVIATALNEHDRVLVVYGAGQFIEQRYVLNKMMGVPSEIYTSDEL